MLATVAVCLLFIPAVITHPEGAPPDRCNSMLPDHGGTAQNTSAPYTVSFGSSTYSPNQTINVTLSGTKTFRGFLIEPRSANATNVFTTYGTITNISQETKNPCDTAAGLTHTSNIEKSSVSFNWTAPSSNVGNIVFVYTVVQNLTIYWVQLTSPNMTFLNQATATNASSTTRTTTNSTKAIASNATTAASSTTQTIDQAGQCGVSVNCYPVGVDCSTDCNFSVMWLAEANSSSVMFTLKKMTTSPNYYIAIGFSQDMDHMGDDSVVACISTNGSVKVQASYNIVGDNNIALDNPNFGLTLMDSSYSDGMLSCTFKRKVSALVAGNESYSSQFYDLAKDYYLLVAYGVPKAGELQQHVDDDGSGYKINFLGKPKVPTQSTTGTLVKKTECGTSLGCFHDCASDGSCNFLLTWADKGGDSIDMTLACKRSSDQYCAIGLSSDNDMGDDSVIQCIPNSNASVYLSYNSGKSNTILGDPQIGLTGISTLYADGILRCAFSRKKTLALATANSGRKKRATVSDIAMYKDMNSDWILMLAYGGFSGSSISKHAALPTISDQKVDFQSFADIGSKEVVSKVVKAHGILMVLAWLLFATFGIFMARFYKTVWPEGMEWLGNKRWFVVHRACMVLALLLTAASFIMIFIDVKGYADITGSNFQMSHPIIGIIIMGLAVINPVMSIFRCAPTASKRPIFNWAHRFVGVSAHVLSVINIFSGVSLAEAQVSRDVIIPLWIYVGWVGLLEILFLFYDCVCTKVKKQEMYELKNISSDVKKPQGQVHTPKVILLILHLIALLALTIAVCVLVGQTSS